LMQPDWFRFVYLIKLLNINLLSKKLEKQIMVWDVPKALY